MFWSTPKPLPYTMDFIRFRLIFFKAMENLNSEDKISKIGRPLLPESEKKVQFKFKISPTEKAKLRKENLRVKPNTPFSVFIREKLLGEESIIFSMAEIDEETRKLLIDSSRLASAFILMAKSKEVPYLQSNDFKKDSENIRLAVQGIYKKITELTKSGMYLIKVKEVSDSLKTIVEDLNSERKLDKNRVAKMVLEEQENLEKLYQDILKKQK
jgi:hypothetical protein